MDSPSLLIPVRRRASKAIAETGGRVFSESLGLLQFSPEQERQIGRLPAYSQVRIPLQKAADGVSKFKLLSDGSAHPGRYGIDSLGRVTELDSGTMDSGITTFDSGRMTMDAG